MNNILITSAGRRVSLVRFFQIELQKVFAEAKVIACDFQPDLSAACQVADKFIKVSRVDSEQYIPELLEICLAENIKLVIPTIDTELFILSENRLLFLEKGIQILVSSVDVIKICRNKFLTHQFFTSRNIDVAKSYSQQNYTFPIFVKPSNGSRSVGIQVIKDDNELQKLDFSDPKLMFLEYLSPTDFNEFTCDLYYDKNHQLIAVVPRQRLFVRDGEVNKSVTRKNFLVSFIKENLAYIEGAIGCLTTQFFLHKNNQKVIGIEINPRFGGGFPLTYLANANFPKYLIQEYFLQEKLSYTDDWEDNLLMLRYDHEVIVSNYEG